MLKMLYCGFCVSTRRRTNRTVPLCWLVLRAKFLLSPSGASRPCCSRQSRAPLPCSCFAPPGALLLLAPLGPPVLRLGPLGVLRGSCPSGSFLVAGRFPASLPLRRGWLCFLFSVAGPWPARCLRGFGGAVFVLALRRLRLFASLCGLPLALPALRALSVRVCICSVVCFVSGFFFAAYVFLVDLLG